MNLKNITIKNKLIAGFGILALLVLLVAGMSLRALSASTEGFAHYVHGINARADMAAQIRTAVDRRAIAARNLVLVTKPADLELEKAESPARTKTYRRALGNCKACSPRRLIRARRRRASSPT